MRSWKQLEKEKCSNAMFKGTLNYLHHVHVFLHWVFKEIRLESPSSNWRSNLKKTPLIAFDRLKYKRLWPRYIADMNGLRSTHPKTWHELETDTISVTKVRYHFVSIGVETIKPVNKSTKWWKFPRGESVFLTMQTCI